MSSFKKHNPLINAYAQASPKNLKHVVMMVALSIQQRWDTVGDQMQDYKANGVDSRFVWGNKIKTLVWLDDNIDTLYEVVMSAISESKGRKLEIKLMEAFTRVDGLGLAKAGFCCQLVAGRVGCIDVHNLKRLDIPETALKLPNKISDKTRTKKIVDYLDICKPHGCAWLWNTWCQLIADKYPEKWADVDHVSSAHYDFLIN